MTDKTGARKAVLLSAIALIAIGVYREQQGTASGSLYKRVWGVGVLSMFLAVLADFAPGVAGPFAVLTVLGSLTNGGDRALQNLLGGVSAASPPAATGAPASKAASGKGGATVGVGSPAASGGGGAGGAW